MKLVAPRSRNEEPETDLFLLVLVLQRFDSVVGSVPFVVASTNEHCNWKVSGTSWSLVWWRLAHRMRNQRLTSFCLFFQSPGRVGRVGGVGRECRVEDHCHWTFLHGPELWLEKHRD